MTTAVIREAREETGIELEPASLRVVGVMHRNAETERDNERVDFFVAATNWHGEPVNREPEKCNELRWDSLDHLPPNVVPYVRRALVNYQRGVWFDSFGWPGSRN